MSAVARSLCASRAGWPLLLLTALSGCGEPAAPIAAPLLVFGKPGHGPVTFNYPRAMALTKDGVVIVDKSARVQTLTRGGAYVREWRTPASEAGKPTGVSVDADGNIYLADTHYAEVLVYSPTGELLKKFGEFGDGPGQFRLPTDVLVAPNGDIYVSEYGGNDRINRFTSDWEFVSSFGGPAAGDASLRRPQCMRIGPDGLLWVTDACAHRICRFTLEGEFRGAFGSLGAEPGQFRFPYSMAFLSDGTIVVAEYGGSRLQHLDPTGKCLGTWGAPGRDPGQLAFPWAVEVDESDRVFVLDSGNNRVLVIAGLAEGTWGALAGG